MEILEPFKVPVVLHRGSFEGRDELLETLKRDLDEAIRTQRDPTVYQVKELHRRPYAKPLVDVVERIFASIYVSLGWDASKAWPVLTAMWGNASLQGMGIHVHRHPNSFFSGVWYPEGSQGTGIVFTNPIQAAHILAPVCASFTPYNAGQWTYEFGPDSFIFFPSYIEHWCPPHGGERPRYSVSFNFFLKGTIQQGMSAVEL